MFTEEELSQLPLDADSALAKAHELIQSKTFNRTIDLWYLDEDGDEAFNVDVASDYLSMLYSIAKELKFTELARICDVQLHSENRPDQKFNSAYNLIKRELLRSVVSRGLSQRTEQRTIGFSPDTRSALHGYIALIRNEIHKIELPLDKKESILRRLNDLAKEIDTDRTRLQSLAELALDLSDTADDVHKKLSPIRRLLERLFRKFGEAREEQGALSGPEERKRIEGPKPEDETPEIDNEIPF